MHFDLLETDEAVRYKLLTSLVVPRPIAWITSRNEAGQVNLAPFSCFNLMSYEPPLVAIGFQAQPDGTSKHTLSATYSSRHIQSDP